MKKIKTSDSLTLGFALFAMFFGAGNLIFPPYLGFMSGGNWFIGFICFIAADAGLSLLALFTIAWIGDGVEGITEVLGSKMSKLFLALSCLSIGPFIAIPRTGSIAPRLRDTRFTRALTAISTTVHTTDAPLALLTASRSPSPALVAHSPACTLPRASLAARASPA